MSQNKCMSCRIILFKCGREKKLPKLQSFADSYTLRAFSSLLSLYNENYQGGLSREKIESVFGHCTKFNIRKTDTLQNSISEKRTLHKTYKQKKGHFTKFNIEA